MFAAFFFRLIRFEWVLAKSNAFWLGCSGNQYLAFTRRLAGTMTTQMANAAQWEWLPIRLIRSSTRTQLPISIKLPVLFRSINWMCTSPSPTQNCFHVAFAREIGYDFLLCFSINCNIGVIGALNARAFVHVQDVKPMLYTRICLLFRRQTTNTTTLRTSRFSELKKPVRTVASSWQNAKQLEMRKADFYFHA